MSNYEQFYNPNLLVKPEDAIKLMENHNYKVIDVRTYDEFISEHIEGALHVTRDDIETDAFPYIGMKAPKNKIEKLLSRLGVNSKDNILLTDGHAGYDAARLWWLLKIYGYQKMQLIDGGIDGWKHYKLPVVTGVPSTSPTPTNFAFDNKVDESILASKDEVISALQEDDIILLDTRDVSEFVGEVILEGALKAGRIPGSVHIDYVDAVNTKSNYGIKDKTELEALYGNFRDKPIIAYCQTGVRSAFTTMILTELLGFKNVKNYDGSWVEWTYFQDLPIETDA